MRGEDRAPRERVEDAGGETPVLDLRGLKCPLPVLKAQKRLSREAPGARIAILADDPLAGIDIPHLCREKGHRLLETRREADGASRFLVERGPGG